MILRVKAESYRVPVDGPSQPAPLAPFRPVKMDPFSPVSTVVRIAAEGSPTTADGE
jgi:hypothetical protein